MLQERCLDCTYTKKKITILSSELLYYRKLAELYKKQLDERDTLENSLHRELMQIKTSIFPALDAMSE